jgi:hypothetical protein
MKIVGFWVEELTSTSNPPVASKRFFAIDESGQVWVRTDLDTKWTMDGEAVFPVKRWGHNP